MPSLSPQRVLAALILLLVLPLLTAAQSSTAPASSTPTASTSATIYPSTANWQYYGCWNETTLLNVTGGVRAMGVGTLEATDDMSASTCLDICKSRGNTFAGLEYTRECYCANFINSFAVKVPDTECNLACAGNDTQICGGNLRLTIYQAKKADSSKGEAGTIRGDVRVGSILALGVAMGFLLCLA